MDSRNVPSATRRVQVPVIPPLLSSPARATSASVLATR